MDPMEDSKLVQAILSGDQELFGMLMDRHRPMVHRLCFQMVADGFAAEELAHDAFVEAYLRLDQLRDPAKFRFWLKQIALNLCRMWFRKRKLQMVELSEESQEMVEEEESDEDIHVQMAAGLSLLSAPHRLVLVLHYLERLSYDDIAGFLDIPIGTVTSRLHRARAVLKHIIEASMRRSVCCWACFVSNPKRLIG